MMARAPRPGRQVGRHLVVGSTLELIDPAHLGGSDPDATTDRPVVRDSQGRPYLPGTTLGGLLRALADRYKLSNWDELFGGAKEDDAQGRLIVDDASIEGAGETELRDGVAIVHSTGIAEDQKKYDMELLPAGTCFRMELQVELPGTQQDLPLLTVLVTLLKMIEDAQLVLGARGSRGLGRCRPRQDERRFWIELHDMARPEHLRAWVGRGRNLPGWPTVARQGFGSAADLAAYLQVPIEEVRVQPAFEVCLTLSVDGSLLCRAAGQTPDEADLAQTQRLELGGGGQRTVPVLPGSSLAGVLRHRCARIARTLTQGRRDNPADALVKGMFGDMEKSSRVHVSEGILSGGRVMRHTRVALDPWTGGAREGLLFTADAHYGGVLSAKIRLEPRQKDTVAAGVERALLLLALRDLAAGDLPVGGEGGTGRGRLRPAMGEPFARIGDISLRLRPDGTLEGAENFESDLHALRDHLGVS